MEGGGWPKSRKKGNAASYMERRVSLIARRENLEVWIFGCRGKQVLSLLFYFPRIRVHSTSIEHQSIQVAGPTHSPGWMGCRHGRSQLRRGELRSCG